MTFRELEATLKQTCGAGARRHLLSAYTEYYLKTARHKNVTVTPERMRAVVESINQHVKELQALKRALSKLL